MNKEIARIKELIGPLSWDSLMEHVFFLSTMCVKEAVSGVHNEGRPYPFVVESLYEFAMRMNDNGSRIATGQIVNDISKMIFENPKQVLEKYGPNNFMTLFYLWQIEDRHVLFMKLFRYNWFFSFKNDKVDMKSEFYKKYGCYYDSFAVLCCLLLTTLLAFDEVDPHKKEDFFQYINKTMHMFKNLIELIAISKEDYVNESTKYCSDIDMLVYSLKVSKKYPFIKNGDYYYLYLPHVIITSCTSSLLYRMTDGNDKLYNLFSKEVLEEYYFALAKTQNCYSFVYREMVYGTNKTPDLILVEGKRILFIEVKSFSPNTGTRIMNEQAIEKQISEVVDGLEKLYKFLFINYPKKLDPLANFTIDNRYGILSLRGEASFDRRILYNRLFERLGIEDEKIKKQIIKHIKISCLDEFEDMMFTNTPIGKMIDYYNTPGNEMHYTSSKINNKTIDCKMVNDYEKYIDNLSSFQ